MHRQWLTVILFGVATGVLVWRHAGDEAGLPAPVDPAPELLRAKLNVVIPEVHFVATPLEEALERLRQQAGAVLAVDWDDLAMCGTQRNKGVTLRMYDVSLRQALESTAQEAAGLVRIDVEPQEDGVIVIASMARMNGLDIGARLYDVRDLVRWLEASDPDSVVSGISRTPVRQITYLIEELIAQDSWRHQGGHDGRIVAGGGFLLVFQTPKNHRLLERLLYNLRKLKAGSFSGNLLDAPAAPSPGG